MSDLDREMDAWRQQLEQSGSISADEITELESHLLQEIESLQKSGLRPDEALIIATRRLGHPHELATEYAKNEALMSWKRPAKLALWGALATRLMSLGWSACLMALSYFDLWTLIGAPWLRDIHWWYSVAAQWSVLGLLWLLVENPQGRVARCLAWLEETIRSRTGTISLILGVIAFELANVALRLLLLWFRTTFEGVPNQPGQINFFSFDMVVSIVASQLAWSIPVVVLLVVLIRTEGWKPFARLSIR